MGSKIRVNKLEIIHNHPLIIKMRVHICKTKQKFNNFSEKYIKDLSKNSLTIGTPSADSISTMTVN